ncbi:MAG: hypothetical protein LBQ70_01805 [Prevotellaceae bacterium]|nr:hypothetical protein [Prevotellaceae bacterium]
MYKINGTIIHIPSLTGRLIVAVIFHSTNIPSLTGRAMQRPCPVRDRMLVENSIGYKRPSRQGRNVFVFPLIYRLFADKSLEPENKYRMQVLMSKTSYVYRKTMLCFNSTPSGSHSKGIHFFICL